MQQLSAYLPHDRRFALAYGHALPHHANGAVVFADVSGFTPLTAALAEELGPQRGAEELTTHLNHVYEALIAEVERFGGSVVGFSGDAMVCWFEGAGTGSTGQGAETRAAQRAATCALAMQRAMAAFAAVQTAAGTTVALAVKVTVACGPVERLLVGDPDIQVLDLLAGPTLERLAATAQHTARDEVTLDAHTAALLAEHVTLEGTTRGAAPDQHVVVTGITPPSAPAPWPPLPAPLSDEQTRPWLAPGVYTRIQHHAEPFLAELRPAVALMLQFGSLGEGKEGQRAALERYVRWVQHTAARYKGTLLDITIGDHGNFLYIAFGAPVTHDDDAACALAAARDLHMPPPELAAARGARIGLASGTMRTGAYGSMSRRVYGVLGDPTNLAARLMNQAEAGTVLCDESVVRRAGARWTFAPLPPITVKGKNAPVAVFQPIGPQMHHAAPATSTVLIGREAERAELRASLDAVAAGASRVLILRGDAGIGKSHLVNTLIEQLPASGITGFVGAAHSIEQHVPYHAWRDMFRAFFELETGTTIAEAQARIEASVTTLAPSLLEYVPLLNVLLDTRFPETELSRSMSAQQRSERLLGVLVELLRARAAAGPMALILEDAHWLDSLSCELATRVAYTFTNSNVLLVLTMRPVNDDHPGLPVMRAMLAAGKAHMVQLHPLSEEALTRLVTSRLGLPPDALPPALARLLHERAGGNPFFAQEIATTLRERGLLRVEHGAEPRCVLHGDLHQANQDLPETLHGLLLARIDRLPHEQQFTLKVAAVLGYVFNYLPLQRVRQQHAPTDTRELQHDLRALAAHDFTELEAPEPELAYRFRHVLTQQAAYQSLLYTQRRALHRAVAEWYEQASSPPLPLLAHHYRQAEDAERERHYAWLAGVHAAEQFANREAAAFFTRALELTPACDFAARYSVLLAREQVYDVQADRSAQHADLSALDELAHQLGDTTQHAEVALRWASFYSCTSSYNLAIQACQKVIALAQANCDREREAMALLHWGRAHVWLSQGEAAIEHLERARVLAAECGLASVAAEALRLLGICAFQRSDFAAARTCYDHALEAFRACADRRGEMRTLNNMAILENERGANENSLALCQQALVICRMIGDRWFESALLTNSAIAACDQADYDRALTWYEQAEQICLETDDTHSLALVFQNRGNLWNRVGERARACDHFQRALELFRRMAYQSDASQVLCELSTLACDRGEYQAAVVYGQQALEAAQATEYPLLCALPHWNIGCAQQGMGEFAAAYQSYEQSLHLYQQWADSDGIPLVSASLAHLAIAQGQVPYAQTLLETVLTHLAASQPIERNDRLRVYFTCYQALQALQDERAAEVLQAGYQVLHARAALIANETLRHSFLNIPVHRFLLAEHASLFG